MECRRGHARPFLLHATRQTGGGGANLGVAMRHDRHPAKVGWCVILLPCVLAASTRRSGAFVGRCLCLQPYKAARGTRVVVAHPLPLP